ncbi:hypothetical protein JDV02_007756 [Purpureocillium takamizusanense]|uniref:Uncharacterized protein n=1 Tax=Purpureocillium takamizusanense TaxID=2060973 RepID=A0A9Q8VCM3_9HYPO|nr:uncharacterized protein JDV02_007756 [Purpureocillium takamizusanense]UNI21800.1 hypothetical protein JDV02_007756 [Purpureocillium takamizusanense]
MYVGSQQTDTIHPIIHRCCCCCVRASGNSSATCTPTTARAPRTSAAADRAPGKDDGGGRQQHQMGMPMQSNAKQRNARELHTSFHTALPFPPPPGERGDEFCLSDLRRDKEAAADVLVVRSSSSSSSS